MHSEMTQHRQDIFCRPPLQILAHARIHASNNRAKTLHLWLSTMAVLGDHKAATQCSAGSILRASSLSSHSKYTCTGGIMSQDCRVQEVEQAPYTDVEGQL